MAVPAVEQNGDWLRACKAGRWRIGRRRLGLFGTVVAFAVLLVGGCVRNASEPGAGGRDTPSIRATSDSAESPCESRFRDASDGRVGSDVDHDLDPALQVCGSLAEWTAAWRRFPPPGLSVSQARFVAENRCMTGNFNHTDICRELGIQP